MASNAQRPKPFDARPVDVPGVLATLVELSRSYGSDPEMTLAGGGNTSAKLGGHLLVKASGVALSQIGPDNFVDLDRAALQALLESDLAPSRAEREAASKDALLAARRSPAIGQRPSVESVLHHLMPGRFVVHLHATVVNQFACSRDGRRLVEQRLGQDVGWVGLVDPGVILAKSLQAELRAFTARTGKQRPRAVILQNHGVVVSGDTPEEARAQVDWLLGELQAIKERAAGGAPAGAPPGASPRPGQPRGPRQVEEHRGKEQARQISRALTAMLTSGVGAHPEVLFDASDVVAGLLARDDGRRLALGGPVTPDQIVYCRSFPLWLEVGPGDTGPALERHLAAGVHQYAERHGGAPKVVLVPGAGMFTWGATWPEADTARLVYRDAVKIMTGALDLGGVNYLDDDFRGFIEDWELETYRRKRLFGPT
jgi:rhamnulokinase